MLGLTHPHTAGTIHYKLTRIFPISAKSRLKWIDLTLHVISKLFCLYGTAGVAQVQRQTLGFGIRKS